MITAVYNNFEGSGLIISPGCVIPQFVSDSIIRVAVSTIKNLKK
jgi:hypothetical protein